MAKTSDDELHMEDVHHRQPDGTMLLVRKFTRGKPRRRILFLPGLGESLQDGVADQLAPLVVQKNMEMIAVEPRGHTLSQGRWEPHSFRVDIAYWIARLAPLTVVASGLSASAMLEYEEQAHKLRPMPLLPDAMVLIEPVLQGKELLPQRTFLHRVFPKTAAHSFLHCRLDHSNMAAFRSYMDSYVLPPIRVQTPTVLLVREDVKKVFGNVKQRTLPAVVATSAGHARRIEFIAGVIHHALAGEKPIRFSR